MEGYGHPRIIPNGSSPSVHLGAAYNQSKGALGGPEAWVLCGGLENLCSVLLFSTFSDFCPIALKCVSAHKRGTVYLSTCTANKLNLPYIWKVWGDKYTDNHELPWILTQPLGELQVTNTAHDRKFMPSSCYSETEVVPWSLKISACFKSCEGIFFPSWHHFWWFIVLESTERLKSLKLLGCRVPTHCCETKTIEYQTQHHR